jgi:hypothetical protein
VKQLPVKAVLHKKKSTINDLKVEEAYQLLNGKDNILQSMHEVL